MAAVYVTGWNRTDRPLVVDSVGRRLDGGDAAPVVAADPAVLAAVALGSLAIVPDPGPDLSAVLPVVAAAIVATRAANGTGPAAAPAVAPAPLLIGTGVPDAAFGSVGSRYEDETTGLVYGPKTASGWGAGRALGNGTFGASSYTYNGDGTVATETAGGVTTTYTYNADGSVHTAARSGTTLTYSYNGDGTIASVA